MVDSWEQLANQMQEIDRTILAEFLKGVRKKRNLSQKQLSQLLGLTQNTVYAWENCISKPTLKSLEALARLEGLTVMELFNMLSGAPQEDRSLPATAQEVLPYLENLTITELLLLVKAIMDKILNKHE